MKRPALLILISLIIGILFSYFLRAEKEIKLVIYLILIGLIFISNYFKMDKKLRIFTLLFFVGFFIMGIQKTEGNFYFDEFAKLRGEVLSVNKGAEFQKYEVKVFEVNGEVFNEKTILSTKGDFEIGDVVEFSGELREIRENTNPKLFNYRNFYINKSIFSGIFSEDVRKVGSSGDVFLILKRHFNNFVENTFNKSLSIQNSDIMKRIFLGTKYDLEFEENVREIGISHILAVSGLHIGIIYFLFTFIFKFLPISKLLREVLIIILLILYSNLIGNPSSVLRAIIYISVITYTKLSGRIVDNLNSLFVTAFIILVFKPYGIFDLGLYFSFLSVLGIILILPRISKKNDGVVISSLKVTFAISILIIPIMLNSFGEFSIMSFIGNLIIVPFFVICIILGFFMLLLGVISIKFSILIGFFVEIVLNLIRENIEFLNFINFKFEFYEMNKIFLILYYICLYIVFSGIYRNINVRQLKFLFISITISTILINFYNINRNLVRINFIDIGQGDSILIRGLYNNALVDTGGITYGHGDNGKSVLIPYLKKEGVNKLDFVFISHLDSDHCKNLKLLSEEIEIENLIFRNDGYRDYLEKFGNVRANKIIDIEKESKINLKDMDFHIFQIPNGFEENERSIILNLNANDKKVLFTGDIGVFTENQILNRDIKCDYLKIPHHGSKNSNSEEFLKMTGSKNAIISCGYKNRYGHPHKDALERMKNSGMNIYRTDMGGNIILEIDRYSDKIISYREINDNLISFMSFYRNEIILVISFYIVFLFLLLEYKKVENFNKNISVDFRHC